MRNQRGHMAQRHARRSARCEGLARMGPVVKSVALPGDFLAGLMALAGNQNDVTVMRLQHGVGDRRGTVGFDAPGRTGHQRRDHLRQDAEGVFRTRVVAGKHHAISAVHGRRAHERAFARVAVTAATHHAPELSAARLRHRTQGRQCLGQAVRCVGVVDQHQRVEAAWCGGFHTTGWRLQTAAGGGGQRQRRALAAQRGDHTEKVGDVVGTGHCAVNGLQLTRLAHFKGHAAVRHADMAGLQTGCGLGPFTA